MENTRLKALHKVFYKHRYYLPKLDKITNVCFNISKDAQDVMFTFNSRYGNADIIICKDYMTYQGPKRSFNSNDELDYYQENALRELELYIFRIYKPKKEKWYETAIRYIKNFFKTKRYYY